MKLMANIDLDGVVYDFDRAIGDCASVLTGRPREDFPRPKGWYMSKDWNMTPEEWRELFREAVELGVFNQGPEYLIVGAKDGIERLARTGFGIRFVSAKLFKHAEGWNAKHDVWACSDALEFLGSVGLLDLADDIVFVRGLNGQTDKRDYPATLVVDDKPDTAGWAQPGAINMVYPQAYNVKFDRSPAPGVGVVRVANWDHIARIGAAWMGGVIE